MEKLKMEPVLQGPELVFRNEAQARELLNEWAEKLRMNDWIIALSIVTAREMDDPNDAGEAKPDYINRCGTIRILRAEDMPDGMIMKQPMECTLIHELLHFVFVAYEEKSRDEAMFELQQHANIEMLARALYMAKYDLKPEWFANTDTDGG